MPGLTRSCITGFRAALLLICSTSNVIAAELSVVIEGLDDHLTQAVRASLDLQNHVGREVSEDQAQLLFSRAQEQIRQALQPFGYYNATVTGDLERTDQQIIAHLQVEPGSPVIVSETTVRVLGAGADVPAVQAAVESFEPQRGERLVHAQYESSKAAIEGALRAHGFLDVNASTHRIAVSVERNTADIELIYRSGSRYWLGPVNFTGGQFPQEVLQRFIPWEPGAAYTADRLLNLQQHLVQSEYFSTVTVRPDLQNIEGRRVPVDVLLVPGKRNAYLASLFYGTDSSVGGNITYERRWLNDRGHKGRVEIERSERLQEYETIYRMPLAGAHQRSYNFGLGYRDENTVTTQSRSVRALANESRQWRGFTRTLGFQYLMGDFDVASERRTAGFLFPQAALSRKAADDFAFPLRGHSITTFLRGSYEGVLADTSFAQWRVDGHWIRSPGDNQRFILRGSLGATMVDDFNELLPELRFFAGGDRSVRGYNYQEIGSIAQNGEVLGGKHLLVASTEYEYYFNDSWGAAVFVDAGDAFGSSDLDLHIGTGIGARWRSPVGIVRLDFAMPVGSELADGLRIHVMIGPDL